MCGSQPIECPAPLANDAGTPAIEAGFEELVKRQSRFAFRVAYSLVRHIEDAEDAVQEAFLRLYRDDAWRRASDERGFLARTVWRTALDRRARRTTAPLNDELPDAGASPEHALISADLNQLVHRLIDALPEELRQPLALSTVEELSSPEIAMVMGIAEGTVRTRLMRARQILKEKLTAITGGKS